MKRLGALLVLALVSCPAGAEVRLGVRGGAPELIVRAAPRGAWSPLPGSSRDDVLNPDGDVLGDGQPGQATRAGSLGAAWIRSSTSEIVLLDVPARGGTNSFVWPVHDAAGTPIVLPASDGWLALWQSRSGQIWAMGWSSLDASDPSLLADGWLADAVVIGDDAIVAVLDAEASELVGLTLSLGRALPIPVPIKTFQTSVTLRDEALPAVCLGGEARGGSLAWDAGQGTWGVARIADGAFETPSFVVLPGRSKPTCEAVLRLAR